MLIGYGHGHVGLVQEFRYHRLQVYLLLQPVMQAICNYNQFQSAREVYTNLDMKGTGSTNIRDLICGEIPESTGEHC